MPLTAVYCLVEVSYVTEMSVSTGFVEKGTMAEQSDPAGGFSKEMSASKREIENGDPAVPQTNRIEALEESPDAPTPKISQP